MMLVLLTIVAFNFEAGVLKLEKRDSFYVTRLLDSVYIYNDTMKILGDYGVFNEKDNMLFVGGDVLLLTPEIRALSDSLMIREGGNIIHFMGSCEIVQKESDTLWGKQVKIVGDTLLATDSVRGHFTKKNLLFYADTLLAYDSTYILMGQDVWIKRIFRDTLVFKGAYLRISGDTVFSDAAPVIEVGKYIVKGDTFYYQESDSSGSFFGSVTISWDSGIATGDTVFFYLQDESLDSLILTGKCNLQKRAEKNTVELNGSLFRVYFENDSLKELVAESSHGVMRSRRNE